MLPFLPQCPSGNDCNTFIAAVQNFFTDGLENRSNPNSVAGSLIAKGVMETGLAALAPCDTDAGLFATASACAVAKLHLQSLQLP